MDNYELKKRAGDLIKKEKFEKAIQIYETLLERSPNDTSVMLKLGNIYQTIGQERAAVKIYSRAADFFYDREMYHQGIAVCRLILKANPLDILAQKRLVDMYIKLYGGLPKKRGDTIMPPQFTEHYSTIPPMNRAAVFDEDTSPTTTASRDSWQPVDIVFSDSDVDTLDPYDTDPDEPTRAPQPSDTPDESFEHVPKVPVERLPPIPLLAPLNSAQLKALIQHTPFMAIPPNTFILREGETGDSLFIIVEGLVNVLKGDAMQPVARLGVGACFGEMALFGPRSRRASVVTLEPTIVMELGRDQTARLQERYPAIRQSLRKYLRQRLLDNLLATCSLFTPFPSTHRDELKRHFFLKEFKSKETVFELDEPVNELFLIVDGAAEMYLDLPTGERELIRTMSIGEIFGEEPLVTGKPSKVTVQAKAFLTTLCLPKAKFKELIMSHPRIVSTVSELLGTIPPPPNPIP